MTGSSISAELIAVVVAVTDGAPRVLTVGGGGALPSGPLDTHQGSMQAGLRNWVERQTHYKLGYIEQLYTFADRASGADRARGGQEHGNQGISISYLGLTREAAVPAGTAAAWGDWYKYFPWEDARGGNGLIEAAIIPGLDAWAGTAPDRRQRMVLCFGAGGAPWNEDLALSRYELLYEAGLVREAARDGRPAHGAFVPGATMEHDHRRILATAISRLRAKIKYRPVVFELMPESFTLLDLQRAVEALAGRVLHKPNFRRLMEDLVEETGQVIVAGGRPAKLFRFRAQILAERGLAGTRLPLTRV